MLQPLVQLEQLIEPDSEPAHDQDVVPSHVLGLRWLQKDLEQDPGRVDHPGQHERHQHERQLLGFVEFVAELLDRFDVRVGDVGVKCIFTLPNVSYSQDWLAYCCPPSDRSSSFPSISCLEASSCELCV